MFTSMAATRKKRSRTAALVAVLSMLTISLTGCSEEANAAITKALATEDADTGKPRPPMGMKEVQMPLNDGRLVTCITLEVSKTDTGVGAGLECDFAGATQWEAKKPEPSPSSSSATPAAAK